MNPQPAHPAVATVTIQITTMQIPFFWEENSKEDTKYFRNTPSRPNLQDSYFQIAPKSCFHSWFVVPHYFQRPQDIPPSFL